MAEKNIVLWTVEQLNVLFRVLEHLGLDEIKERVVSDLPLQTTLNSLYLGGQVAIKGGFDNVFFTNITRGINNYPAWGGIKDQSILANQDETGVEKVSAREYSNLIELGLNGPEAAPITYTPYRAGFTLTVNVSTFGIKFRPENTLPAGQRLLLCILVPDENGNEVYQQQKILESEIIGGELFEWWFEQPVEGKVDTVAYITVEKVAEDGTKSDLSVSATVLSSEIPWADTRLRIFEDKELKIDDTPFMKSYSSANVNVDTTGVVIPFDTIEGSNEISIRTETAGEEEVIVPGEFLVPKAGLYSGSFSFYASSLGLPDIKLWLEYKLDGETAWTADLNSLYVKPIKEATAGMGGNSVSSSMNLPANTLIRIKAKTSGTMITLAQQQEDVNIDGAPAVTIYQRSAKIGFWRN